MPCKNINIGRLQFVEGNSSIHAFHGNRFIKLWKQRAPAHKFIVSEYYKKLEEHNLIPELECWDTNINFTHMGKVYTSLYVYRKEENLLNFKEAWEKGIFFKRENLEKLLKQFHKFCRFMQAGEFSFIDTYLEGNIFWKENTGLFIVDIDSSEPNYQNYGKVSTKGDSSLHFAFVKYFLKNGHNNLTFFMPAMFASLVIALADNIVRDNKEFQLGFLQEFSKNGFIDHPNKETKEFLEKLDELFKNPQDIFTLTDQILHLSESYLLDKILPLRGSVKYSSITMTNFISSVSNFLSSTKEIGRRYKESKSRNKEFKQPSNQYQPTPITYNQTVKPSVGPINQQTYRFPQYPQPYFNPAINVQTIPIKQPLSEKKKALLHHFLEQLITFINWIIITSLTLPYITSAPEREVFNLIVYPLISAYAAVYILRTWNLLPIYLVKRRTILQIISWVTFAIFLDSSLYQKLHYWLCNLVACNISYLISALLIGYIVSVFRVILAYMLGEH